MELRLVTRTASLCRFTKIRLRLANYSSSLTTYDGWAAINYVTCHNIKSFGEQLPSLSITITTMISASVRSDGGREQLMCKVLAADSFHVLGSASFFFLFSLYTTELHAFCSPVSNFTLRYWLQLHSLESQDYFRRILMKYFKRKCSTPGREVDYIVSK